MPHGLRSPFPCQFQCPLAAAWASGALDSTRGYGVLTCYTILLPPQVCAGPGIPSGLCSCNGLVLDCRGQCGGAAIIDACGSCEGSGTVKGSCDCTPGHKLDCAGICNGATGIDVCGVCGGDGGTCSGPSMFTIGLCVVLAAAVVAALSRKLFAAASEAKKGAMTESIYAGGHPVGIELDEQQYSDSDDEDNNGL